MLTQVRLAFFGRKGEGGNKKIFLTTKKEYFTSPRLEALQRSTPFEKGKKKKKRRSERH